MSGVSEMLTGYQGMRLTKKAAIAALSLFGSACWLKVMSFDDSSLGVITVTGCVVLVIVSLLITWRATRKNFGWVRECAILGVLMSSAIVFGWRIATSGCVDDIFAMGDACLGSPSTYILIAGLSSVAFCGSVMYLTFWIDARTKLQAKMLPCDATFRSGSARSQIEC